MRLAEAIKAVRKHARFVLLGDVDAHNPATISPSQLEIWKEKGSLSIGDGLGMMKCRRSINLPLLSVCYLTVKACPKPCWKLRVVEGLRSRLTFLAVVKLFVRVSMVTSCPFGMKNALRSVVMKLIDDKETSERLGKRGREIVIEEFSSDIINKQTFDLWDSLLR